MKKGFEKIVAWQYDGWTAIGVLFDSDEYVSVALNYKMDSNIQEGDLWYSDSIHTDEGTEVRPATDDEIKKLCKALDNHHVAYMYDEETKTILDYRAYYYSYNNGLSINEYQRKAMTTCMPSSNNFSYMFLNLVGEVGEFASKVAKAIRKEQVDIGGVYDMGTSVSNDLIYKKHRVCIEQEAALKAEAGDILWQLSGLCAVMGWNLEDVAQMNLDKLASRQQRNVIEGEGDNR